MSRRNFGSLQSVAFVLAAGLAFTGDRPRVAAADLQHARTAVVGLQRETSSLSNPQESSQGEAAAPLVVVPGGAATLAAPPATRPPRSPGSEAVTGIRVNIAGKPLILSVLNPTVRETDSLQLIVSATERRPVTVLAWDPANGLALLQDAPGERPDGAEGSAVGAALTLSETPATWSAPVLVVSQWRPGNPVVSAGVVSTAHGIDVSLGAEVFQTDAVVAPGSRGAAVLNQEGHVIGVIHAPGGERDAVGLSTAIGVESIRRLTAFVSEGGQGAMPKARLGVGLEVAPTGVLISSVAEGSAAKEAGIAVGDVIAEIDQQRMALPEDVFAAVNAKRPRDVLEVTVQRGGKKLTMKVTLAGTFPVAQP